MSAEGVKCYISAFYFVFLFSCQLKSASSFSLFLLLLYFSSLSKNLFSTLYDCYTPKRYWGCFKCNSERWSHYFHVRTDVVCTHHSEKKISFLFGLCLAIVPVRQLKAFRLTTILCFLFLSQWHSDVIPLWGMSKEVRSLLRVPRVF